MNNKKIYIQANTEATGHGEKKNKDEGRKNIRGRGKQKRENI